MVTSLFKFVGHVAVLIRGILSFAFPFPISIVAARVPIAIIIVLPVVTTAAENKGIS